MVIFKIGGRRKKMKKTVFVMMVLLVYASCSFGQTNYLANPSFELPEIDGNTVVNGAPDDWEIARNGTIYLYRPNPPSYGLYSFVPYKSSTISYSTAASRQSIEPSRFRSSIMPSAGFSSMKMSAAPPQRCRLYLTLPIN